MDTDTFLKYEGGEKILDDHLKRSQSTMQDPHVRRLMDVTAEMVGKSDEEIRKLSREFNNV